MTRDVELRPGDRVGDAVYVGTWPAGTPEWHEARRTTINGSEVAPILGISPYESPFSLWHRKVGLVGDIEQTPEMYWGSLHEATIREEFNRRHNRQFRPLGLFRHHQRTWQGGGPDGIDGDEILEIKFAVRGDAWGPDGTDEIPVHYRAQVLWYLDVFGFQRCHVVALIAGYDYREYLIEASPDEVAFMRAKAREFLDSVEAGIRPPIDGHEATYQTVRELHPDIDPGQVELPDHIAEPYLQALAAHRDAEAERRRCTALVLDAMGRARDAFYAGQLIARRQAKSHDGAVPYLVAARGVVDRFSATPKGTAA